MSSAVQSTNNCLFAIAHTHADGAIVWSIDIQRHHDNGGEEQYDVFDELLKDVEPIPQVCTTPLLQHTPATGLSESVSELEDGERASLVIVQRKRVCHNLLTDAIIIKYVDVHGPKWRELSRTLGGTTAGYSDDVVRNRYIRIMKALGTPYMSSYAQTFAPRKPEHKLTRWKPESDALILEGIRMFGTKWDSVARHVGGHRTRHAVRNRANRIFFKSKSK